MTETFDIAVIGAGIAGASLAAELAAIGGVRIVVLEAEDRPGYHTTGRSAAFWEECYGGPKVVPLTLASGPWLQEHGFLSPRGALYVGQTADEGALDEFMNTFAGSGVSIERLGRTRLEQRLPGVRGDYTGAVWEPACADIDVAALHQHYLAGARRKGVELRTRWRVAAAERDGAGWRLASEHGGALRAGVIANGAGAWADSVAALAGARALGIQPLRRTVAQLRTDPPPPADLPLVLDIAGRFYFKPESGRLWLSPHDEEPSPPCDAAPEELAVAEAIDRFERVVDWRVRAVERKWAGLRSFAPDRLPVYGFDPAVPGFFWFAGQGGFGIQTAPAAARLGAQLLHDAARDKMTERLDAGLYDPARFRSTHT
ncbi:Hydrogen cyanide synthase subunit HcnC precursor [Tsuneonella dongtanensis]|uniref:Hydrogen cyanide synthase subunit HcnC n=1 Tax=Tsuneonella dongtanensis TaxID=692370 RepID=A0A1B2AGN0_9SPHN|nr:FAD-dependent oxidoreductase [Tsuneonella dongtanensis]ANY21313.1 Hydrogen cyanide synthase subunit HcnC precursor [Tsuneonella dongtanensis]